MTIVYSYLRLHALTRPSMLNSSTAHWWNEAVAIWDKYWERLAGRHKKLKGNSTSTFVQNNCSGGTGNLLFGGHSSKWLHCSVCKIAKVTFIDGWLPWVFLACGGNFRCWPKADTSSAVDLTETGNRARKVSGTQPTKKKTPVHARNRDEEDTTHNQSDVCYFCIRLHHQS